MPRPSVFILFLLLVFSTAVISQTFDDFKKQVNDDYHDFRQKTIQSFDEHVEQTDKAFADYLATGFGEYALSRRQVGNTTPKPQTIPVHQKQSQPGREKIELANAEQPSSQNEIVLPIIKKSETSNFETNEVSLQFFGSEVALNYDVQFIAVAGKANTPEAIAAAWTALSQSNYNHLIDQFNTYRQVLNLNDWAYYQLIKTFSATVYPSEPNLQNLLSWFLLTRAGYKTRIAFNGDQNYLLLSSVYPLAGNYLRFGQVNYYLPEGQAEHLQTYEVDVPQADKIMDLSISKPLNLAGQPVSRQFGFSHRGQQQQVDLAYNKNLIDFYATYPLADIGMYFNSLPGTDTKHSVEKAFGPLVAGKTEVEAAAILLSFVQQAFEYKTDQEAYGKEKYMFADELLHYPYADCEDRSVLYAWLVKTLLHLDVAGVEFPGHMATAIHFSENPRGEFVTLEGKEYVVADPTFSGAPLGMLMPGVEKSEARVVQISSSPVIQNKAGALWQIVHEYGGFKGDILQDVVFAPSGNAYVCGYFINTANFGGHQLVSEFEGRDVFIAKFDADLNPVWAKKATGPGNDMAYSLALDPKGILYVYGSVEQSLDFDGQTIEAQGAPDVFVARYAPDGMVRWINKAGIDKIDHTANFMFSAKFNPAGEKIGARLYSETMDFDYYGLNLDGEGNAVITGSFYATTGLNAHTMPSFHSAHDIPKVLKDTNDFLRDEQHFERTIAGVFSALRLIEFDNFELSGSTLQNTLNTYNKPFASAFGNFYKNIGRLSFVINKTGIVVINTENKQPVDFKYLRIEDNARIKIITYNNGNSKIDVLSGIKIVDASGNKTFDMNSISLSKETGDLLLDYDDDHSKFKSNLRSQLLE